MRLNELVPAISDEFFQQQVERYRNMWGTNPNQSLPSKKEQAAATDQADRSEKQS